MSHKPKRVTTDPAIEATRAAFVAQIILDINDAVAILEDSRAFEKHADTLREAALHIEDNPSAVAPMLNLLIPVTTGTVLGLLRNAEACIARMPSQAT
jgi:hypothetical protein